MITKMSKYAFLIYHKEYDEFLLRLRDLGVVHIKENTDTKGLETFRKITEQRREIESMLTTLKTVQTEIGNVELAPARPVKAEDYEDLFFALDTLLSKKAKFESRLTLVEKDIAYMESTWGGFDYKLLTKIRESGYCIDFFSTPLSEYNKEWEETYNAIPIRSLQSHIYFITITAVCEPAAIPAEKIKLPEFDLSELKHRTERINRIVSNLNAQLETRAVADYNTLVELDKVLQDDFNLSNTRMQSLPEADEKLMLLEGWLPQQKTAGMEQGLDSEGYYFHKLEIAPDDDVPIQLKNNRFSKHFEPICKLFSLPNYNEFDPTPFLAPFFMLFFGICFADGGYGLLIMIVGAILKRKVAPDMRSICTFAQYLGAAAVFVGILTGSFFGIALVDIPAFAGVKEYFLSSDNMMIISLVVGVVHILFGKVIAALKIISQKGVKHGIAPFAWVFTITAFLMIFALPEMSITLPKVVVNILYGVAGAGLCAALLYNAPGKNIFTNLGGGLLSVYNTASGLLGDALSYIRLFAIGLTGAILGGVFNSLAITMTEGMNIVVRILLMTFILLFGHAMNFALCIISSLIHPLRLIFVEYYKNAGFEGGGRAYEPFKKM